MRNLIFPMICSCVAVALIGCGGEGPDWKGGSELSPEGIPPAPSLERLNELDHDLTFGSIGEDVRTVHAYLSSYGYFPNQELARKYPQWRPLVADAPADVAVYDERSVDAVRQFQIHSGLQETGIVDENTRALLRIPRCGNPDGVARLDPSDKFAILGGEGPLL